jgi:hypothetical protein
MQATTAPMVQTVLPALVACASAMVSTSIQVATTAWASLVPASGPHVASSAAPNPLPTALAPHAPPPPSTVQAADQVATAFCLPPTAYPCALNTTLKNLIDTLVNSIADLFSKSHRSLQVSASPSSPCTGNEDHFVRNDAN